MDILEEAKQSFCPLCGTELDTHLQEQVIEELQKEGELMGAKFRKNQARIRELELMLDNNPEDKVENASLE